MISISRLSSVAIAPILLSLCATSAAAPDALTGTLKKIHDAKNITLGYREYSTPISYVDNNQKPIGYAMDICLRLVEDIKTSLNMPDLKVSYQAVSGPNRIPLLLNGAIDLECGSTTNTKERQQEVAFGPTYFVSNITAIVRTDSGIDSLKELSGKNVAISSGTTSAPLLTAYSKEKDMNIRSVVAKDNAEAFLLLGNGRVAGFVLDDIVLYSARANARDPQQFKVLSRESLRAEPYSVAMRRDDAPFKAVIDKSLSRLLTSGDINAIYAKWFTRPIPPNNINLDFPVSPALQQAFDKPDDTGI